VRTTLRPTAATMVLLIAATTTVACSTATTTNGGSTGTGDAAPAASVLDGKGEVEVTFWHAMTGKNGEALQKLTDQFNEKNKG
jgi:sn-glycerol 3-phosphate transport system substrate-binding protein